MTWAHYFDQGFLNYFGNAIYKVFEAGPSKYYLELEAKITQKEEVQFKIKADSNRV